MTSLSFSLPGISMRSALAYFASKVAAHRVVAIGETHRGGMEPLRFARSVRSFVAEAVIRTRPEALALELDEEAMVDVIARLGLPGLGTTPSGILRIVPVVGSDGRMTVRAEPCSMLNPRAFWLGVYSTLRPSPFGGYWDYSYRDMLLRIASEPNLRALKVRGIDAKLPRRSLPGHGIQRDIDIKTKFQQLINETSESVVVLMGAAHVSKLSMVYDPLNSTARTSSVRDGGFYPLGACVAADMVSNLDSSGYWAIRCLTEGSTLNSLASRDAIAPNNVGPVLDLEATVRAATCRLDSAVVDNAFVRAYDLLSALFFSYECGVDTLGLEEAARSQLATSLLTTTDRVPTAPTSAELGGVSIPRQMQTPFSGPTQFPLFSKFDGMLMFRDFESWHPEDDLLSIPQRRLHTGEFLQEDVPSLYYVPNFDGPQSQWIERWNNLLPDMRGNRTNVPAVQSGLFAGPQDDFREYSRATFAIPSVVPSDEADILVLGYGFNLRGEDGRRVRVALRASAANRTGPDVATTCSASTDRVLAVRFTRSALESAYPPAVFQRNAAGDRILLCDVRIFFPEHLNNQPYTSILHQAVTIVFRP